MERKDVCDEADKEEEAGGRQRERGRETDGGGEEADRESLGQPARRSGEFGKPEKCQQKNRGWGGGWRWREGRRNDVAEQKNSGKKINSEAAPSEDARVKLSWIRFLTPVDWGVGA